MHYNLTIPSQPSDASYGSYVKVINKQKTAMGYGVNSTKGFTIQSSSPLSNEDEIIKRVLAAYVSLEIACENLKTRNEKFIKYVSHLSEEEREEEPEYKHYKRAKCAYNQAIENLKEVKNEFNIIDIKEARKFYYY